MQIIISNSSDLAIYEQIEEQIKSLILSGELTSGEMLPSIRNLAKDLKISVITTKRAYDELEANGFIKTIPGKGSFIKTKSDEFVKEEVLKNIELYLQTSIQIAKQYNIKNEEVKQIFDLLMEDENE